MRVTNIQAVDLNLLAPLRALVEERHVSRAAERARISQPAMSRALARLRGTLGDELLVRGPGGYQLTPRAERIRRELAELMPRLESLLSDDTFDPQTAERVFRLAATDYVVMVLGPELLRRIFQAAPRSTIRIEPWHHTVPDELQRGALDLAITGGATPPQLRSGPLFEDRYVCMLSREHPLASRARLSLDDYLACAHVVVGILDGRQGMLEQRLEALGSPRRGSVVVPYHAAAAAAVPGTDLIATLPALLARELADPTTVLLRAPPELEPMHFSLCWHPRLDNDPAQCWLRDTLRAASPTSPPSDPPRDRGTRSKETAPSASQ